MRKLLIILCLSISGIAFSQELKVLEGNLYYQYHGELILVKSFKSGSYFRGYDLIDSVHIFLAYQPEGWAEASAILSVFDVESRKENTFDELGGTGTSSFDYNPHSKLVVFNWTDGIYVFEPKVGQRVKPKLVLATNRCSHPVWLDDKTISYQIWHSYSVVTKQFRLSQ